MPKLELTQAAAVDLEEIFEHSLAHFGFDQTERYVDSLKNCLALLASNPQLGRNASDIRPGYFRFPHESHVVFYQTIDDGILVVRLLHSSMDTARHLEQHDVKES